MNYYFFQEKADPFAHLVKGREENGVREAPPDTNRVERAIKIKVKYKLFLQFCFCITILVAFIMF